MKKIDINELNTRIKQRFPEEEFEVISYESLGEPMKIKCCSCNNIIEVSKASNFFAKNKVYGCKNCHGLWRERENKLEKIKMKYEIIDAFVKDTHTYYNIKCKKCGHVRTSTLNNLIKYLDCGCETKVFRNRTAEEFLESVNNNAIDGTYELLSPYKNQTEKVLLKHSCGFIWKVRPSDVINGRSFCPKCGTYESKGVRFISHILEQNNIPYEREVRLNNSLQRFDFYFNNDKHPKAIEYNGKQHYEETQHFHTTLKQQQERDMKKRQYCIDNNIELLEIPYYWSNEEIKKQVLNFLSSTTISKESTSISDR